MLRSIKCANRGVNLEFDKEMFGEKNIGLCDPVRSTNLHIELNVLHSLKVEQIIYMQTNRDRKSFRFTQVNVKTISNFCGRLSCAILYRSKIYEPMLHLRQL